MKKRLLFITALLSLNAYAQVLITEPGLTSAQKATLTSAVTNIVAGDVVYAPSDGTVRLPEIPDIDASWFASSNTTYAATTTITRAEGAYKTLTATGPLVLDFDVASYPTNGFSFVALALYSGTNQVSISTNITSNTWAAVTISTNAWNNLIFFKGAGETQFGVRK